VSVQGAPVSVQGPRCQFIFCQGVGASLFFLAGVGAGPFFRGIIDQEGCKLVAVGGDVSREARPRSPLKSPRFRGRRPWSASPSRRTYFR
jgi:hypothetical protein